jgi:hypothetical protein
MVLQDDTYLHNHFTDDQLIAEGWRVCEGIQQSGYTEMQAIDMVKRDLSVSDSGAIDVEVAATVGLGC